MKKVLKASVLLLIFLIIAPSLAGIVVTALWNNIVPAICGFATITFLQGVGLFILGQILSGGFLFALFFIGGGIHALGHHGEWKSHWHNMTDEQRREFINRRRREHFGFRNHQNNSGDATE